ncbi:MAG: tetratricopeptide repeat protein [Chloroflexota bacterium]|nr:MAG: hypothetical protein DIU68_14655 [Chloroflexota bacterium]
MGFFTRSLIERFRVWERPAQIAVVTALVLLALVILLAGLGPPELRLPAIIGVVGLLLVLQLVVLWANRDLVTPFTQAQRHYLKGEFEAALRVLEQERKAANAKELTLLGNTYRQLGRLDESETALREALAKAPGDHFPLYGLGRTLLSKGNYAEAAATLREALDAGAPPVIRSDLAEALYHAGDTEAAKTALHEASQLEQEPHRQFMNALLLWRMGTGPRPEEALLRDGLPYWQATAERFAHTPYGAAVQKDLGRLGHEARQT